MSKTRINYDLAALKSCLDRIDRYIISFDQDIMESKRLIKLLEDELAKKFIQEAIKKPGALRKSLHVKKGEKIPEKKLEKAEHSKNPTTRKRAVLAETLKKMHK